MTFRIPGLCYNGLHVVDGPCVECHRARNRRYRVSPKGRIQRLAQGMGWRARHPEVRLAIKIKSRAKRRLELNGLA